MALAETVRVAWPGLLRRMGNEDGADMDVFLMYKDDEAKGSPDAVVAAVESAVQAANDALTIDGENLVWAQAALPTVKGVMIQLRYVGNRKQNQEWLHVLSTSLEGAGRSGAVSLAPRVAWWVVAQKLVSVPKVTGFVAYSVSEPPPSEGPSRWRVDPATTAAICAHAVEWGAFAGAAVNLGQRTAHVFVEDPDVARPLAEALRRFPMAQVSYETRRPPGYNHVALASNGQVCYQAHRAGMNWLDRVEHVRQALLRDPAALDLAFLRLHTGMAGSWIALGAARPRMPHVEEVDVRLARDLWQYYTPDAHGLQILTDHHLRRANDLVDWNITALEGHRYLVEASDLTAWFAHDTPPDAVVERARLDFGDMILTPDVVAR